MKQEISPELIKRHYELLVESIMIQMVATGKTLTQVVELTVHFFGLAPVKGRENTYEMIPELRKVADDAVASQGAPKLPDTFTEDEALIFCACQTAGLQQSGKLEEVSERLRKMTDDLKTKAKASAEKAPVASNVIPLNPKSFDDDDDGPTFH